MEADHSLYVLKAVLLAGNLFLQRHGGIQFIPLTRFLFGRQGVQSLVFVNPSDEVTVKFSETQIFLVIYNRRIKSNRSE